MTIMLFVVFVALLVAGSMWASGVHNPVRADSVRVHSPFVVDRHANNEGKENDMHSQRMASSTFPVRMQVKGGALCVTSDYIQLLPIYTRGGTFYMAMRLNKGMNWLNGLPRGRYLINNQQISIP